MTTFSQRYATADSNTAGAFLFDTISSQDIAVSKLAYGDSTHITRVDATNPLPVTVPSGASNPAKAEDVASADADVGIPSMAVRKATPANTSGTDGDYEFLQISAGRLWASATIDTALPTGANVIGGVTQSGTWTVGISASQTIAVTNAGTFATQAAQSGTWTVQPGNTANTTAWLVTGTGGTFPATQSGTWNVTNVSGTVSLPTGASTAAKQPALGTAGTASADVITVQGIASMTALKVDGSAVTQPVSGTVTANAGSGTFTVSGTVTSTIAAGATTIAKAEDVASADADVGVGCLAVRKATPANTSGTDGDYEFLQMSAGRLWASVIVDTALPAGTALIGKVGIDQTTVGTTNAVSVAQLGANTVSTGNGTAGTGVLRVSQVSDGTGVLAGVTTVATVTTCSTVTTLTGGGVAHAAADSGNPVKVGAKALTSLATTTLASNANRTDATSDLDGAIMFRPQFPLGDLKSTVTSITSTTRTALSNFTAVASTKNYVTSYSIFRTDTGTTTIYLDINDGDTTTVLWRIPLPPNGGANMSSSIPLLKSTANTQLYFTLSSAVSTVYISIAGFQSKIS